jgi:hypothetical protein
VKEFVTLNLRDKDYTFRALDLDQLEELEPQFAAATAPPAPGRGISTESLRAVAEIATASLQARHAGITVGEVRKVLTIATVQMVMQAIRGISQVAASGEAGAGGQ